MGLCTQALINQVLCEETVTLTRIDRNVPIDNISIPLGSEISGQTWINVLDCNVIRQNGQLGLTIALFIQEELQIVTPQGEIIPLEFGFRFQDFAPLLNCATLINLETVLDELDCRVTSVSGENIVTLNENQTFNQSLKITVNLKVLLESQLKIALCPPYSIPCKKAD